jgi:hypothetical protein
MIQALNHATLKVTILVSILVYIVGCIGCNEQTKQSPPYKFAEIHGQVSGQNQVNTISRLLFIGPDGRKAVVSEIKSVTALWGHKSAETRFLREYLQNDSLFIFDSGDSTCICLSVADAGFSELNLLPLSASWLFFNPVESENTKTDTLAICGYSCTKEHIAGGYLWIYGNTTMAIETINQEINHSERITRCVNDTIFPEGIFNHPLGYRKLVPAQ